MHEGPACLPLHRLATFRSSQQASGGPPKHRYAMGCLTSGLVIASWAPISFVFLLGGANGEPHASDGGGCREVGSMPSGSNAPRKERGGRGSVVVAGECPLPAAAAVASDGKPLVWK